MTMARFLSLLTVGLIIYIAATLFGAVLLFALGTLLKAVIPQ